MMKFRRPRSLNGLILVGFGIVALPLIFAVIWTLFSLDRLATQSERLVFTGVEAAENNRLLTENVGSLERISLQYTVLRNPELLPLIRQDVETIESRLAGMSELTDLASATTLASLDRLERPLDTRGARAAESECQ